jgi:DNA primase
MRYDKPSITAILEHYGAKVPTRRGWFSMKCPFHDDSHASASANSDENAFCCFACQMKGDGYAIIMSKEGVQFSEAINIAKGILDSRGEVLPQRTARSGGISRRAGNHFRAGAEGSIGRRARAANGS